MANEKMPIEMKKAITPEFRTSFEHVFEAHSFEGNEPKYSVTMLFDKGADLSALKKAAANAAIEKWGPKEKWPAGLRLPFRNGDEKTDMDGYAGKIFISASSKQRPQVIDAKKSPITKEDGTFYSGCFARASVVAFAYDKLGNKGVSFSLMNIQKLRDGERFGGRKSAVDEFDSVEDGSDNAENYADLGF